jgi:O-acetyl-ADP-ribose deacetylase (regulator of RNase III)
MKEARIDWVAYAAISAGVLGLPLKPEWEAAVVASLETIFRIAAAVERFQLPDDAEPAPVFEA